MYSNEGNNIDVSVRNPVENSRKNLLGVPAIHPLFQMFFFSSLDSLVVILQYLVYSVQVYTEGIRCTSPYSRRGKTIYSSNSTRSSGKQRWGPPSSTSPRPPHMWKRCVLHTNGEVHPDQLFRTQMMERKSFWLAKKKESLLGHWLGGMTTCPGRV